MSNKNKETISDEQLMAYADNELDDIELIDSKYDFRKVSKDFHDKLVLSKIKGGFDNV